MAVLHGLVYSSRCCGCVASWQSCFFAFADINNIKSLTTSAIILRCVGWRQCGDCSPDGPREEARDRKCAETVEDGSSGYCECEGGRRTKEVGCEHAAFRCKDECKKLFEEDSKPADDAAAGANKGGGEEAAPAKAEGHTEL